RRHTRSKRDWSSDVCSSDLNGAIRRFDPTTDEVTTLARGLREPSDILVIDAGATSGAEGPREAELLVVESAAHALTRVKLPKDEIGRASCRERGDDWRAGEM